MFPVRTLIRAVAAILFIATQAHAQTYVPTTRTLTTTWPLRCDGTASCDLSADRTLSRSTASCAPGAFCVTDPQYAGGAKCDGITDDGPAIKAAGDAAFAVAASPANRFGELEFPACAAGGSYRIATPVAWSIAQATGQSRLKIKGHGLDGPLQIAVGAANVGLSVYFSGIEWSFLEVEGIAMIPGNGSYTAPGTFNGTRNAKYALELGGSVGTVSVRNIQSIGLYVESVLHLRDSSFLLEQFIDNGNSASGGGVNALVYADKVETLHVTKAYSFHEFRYGSLRDGSGTPVGTVNYAGGTSDTFWRIAPSTVRKTRVSLRSVNQDGNRNTYGVLVLPTSGTTPIGSLVVEDSIWNVNTAGILVFYADSVWLKNSQFPLAIKRTIYGGVSVSDSHIASVASSGYGVVTVDAGFLEVNDSDLGADTDSPSGVTHTGTGVALARQNGIVHRLRRAQAAIVASTLIKAGATDGRVDQLGTSDPTNLAIGVAVDAATAAGKYIRVVEALGQGVSIKSDGSTAIVPGDALTSSTISAGRVKKSDGAATTVARSMSTVAATADLAVTGIR